MNVASLGMYDGGELTAANDDLWKAISTRLRSYGVEDLPERLERVVLPPDVWLSPRLLFGQACTYPFAARLSGTLRFLGTPDYAVTGCADGRHCSFIIVPARARTRSLRELRGARAAVNDVESMTGRHLLGDAIASLAEPKGCVIASAVLSGSHARSVAMVAAGDASVAAIDCVSWAHITRATPEVVAETRILQRTRSMPCLPFVIAAACGEAIASLVARALREAVADPANANARRVLRLAGIAEVEPPREDALLVAAHADGVFGDVALEAGCT